MNGQSASSSMYGASSFSKRRTRDEPNYGDGVVLIMMILETMALIMMMIWDSTVGDDHGDVVLG